MLILQFSKKSMRMMKRIHKSFQLVVIIILLLTPALSVAGAQLHSPTEYIQSKLQKNDIVFLGTTHRNPQLLRIIAEIIPKLKKVGVTHIGVEVPSDEQGKIDYFMKTGDGLDNVRFHLQVDHPDYRYLFKVFRMTGLKPIAIDLPYRKYGGEISRDEWMARSMLKVLNKEPAAKILVIVGGLHTLKKLKWEEQFPDKHPSIRQIIKRERPSTKMWLVVQLIHGNPNECDFTKRFSFLPDAVAMDLDDRYRGWKLGLTDTLAIVPVECLELLNGVIVY